MKRSHVLICLLIIALAGVRVARAGNLEPPGPPAPTMKPLTELYTSWHNLIMLPTRFELVMGGEAVLDQETGLVWQQTPLNNPALSDWRWAVRACYGLEVQNRKGWRMPVIEELSTLVDKSVVGGAVLPPGHPFAGVLNFPGYAYWSITNDPYNAADALTLDFSNGLIGGLSKQSPLVGGLAWCVRGGTGHNPDPAP